MTYPLVRELKEHERIPVALTCRVFKLCRQAYYRWLKNPCSERDLLDAYLANAAHDVHREDPEFGYRFIADEIAATTDLVASETRIWKVCRDAGIAASHHRRRGKYNTLSISTGPVRQDWVRREFSTTAPNRLWLTDLTEHPTKEGKLYLCAVKDVFSNRIIGYSMDSRMQTRLAVDALSHAIRAREPVNTVIHSDRGGQFRSKKYHRILSNHGLIGSMGAVGSSADNAAMESFFALLQKNVLNRKHWDTRQELRLAIVAWIHGTYHHKRRQRRLGKLTPIEYELAHPQGTTKI